MYLSLDKRPKSEDDAPLVPQHGWWGVWQKDIMAMPFLGEKGEKAREFETPMKGRERISHFW